MFPPSQSLRSSTDQLIWVTSVIPEPDTSAPVFTNVDVGENVLEYWKHNAVDRFSSQRAYYVDGEGDGGDATDMWTEKTIMTSE
jgi:hypothetical protein